MIAAQAPADCFSGWVDFGERGIANSLSGPVSHGPDGWVAVRGRLDARAPLAQALGVPHEANTPDVELVRLAIEKWQEDAPRYLTGDFALAAWSERSRRLLLAGDLAGLNTVYYWRAGDRLYFATGLRELLRDAPVPDDLNAAYLTDCLAMNLADDDGATPFRHIRKVPAGTCVDISAGRETVAVSHRYDPERRLRLAHDQEYVEAAWDLLQQAVRDRLRGLDKISILGSSGLDSAAVAAATVAVSNKTVEFVTAIPDLTLPTIPLHPAQKNERHLVETLARAFPALQTTFVAPAVGQNWDPGWPELIQANHAPHRGTLNIAWFHHACQTTAQRGAREYLGGAAGNMTLTWDGWRSLPHLVSRGDYGRAFSELYRGCGGSPRRWAGLAWRELLRPLRGPRYDYRSLERYAALRREAVEDFDLLNRMQAAGNDPSLIRSLHSRQWRIDTLARGRARRPELANMQRTLYGLTQSSPLLDRRLVEFCLAIPEDQFLRDGNSRWLARRMLRAAGVPAAVAENRRYGYQHPEWFAHLTEARPAMREQLARLRASELANRLIDTGRLARLLDEWPRDAVASERRASEYVSVLAGALAVGAFICWAEGGRRLAAAGGGVA